MIRLELAGASTHLHAELCARCPMGVTGCCATPPGIEWSDLGRIVARGGSSFLLEEIAAGRLRKGPRGLFITRVDPPSGEGPKRCVYHGPRGCTIAPEKRAATCNYYVCEDALASGEPAESERARGALDTLVSLHSRWDRAIAEEIAARWPEGPPWDEAFLAWLGAEYERSVRASRRELRKLQP